MFGSLLVPVDIDDLEPARPAVARALELARLGDGRLRLVHVRVVPPVGALDMMPTVAVAEPEEGVETRLAEFAATLDLPAERVSAVVRTGSVTAAILAEADEMAADLIVLGSSDPTFLTRIAGSHASSLVRDATCSVLIVRGG